MYNLTDVTFLIPIRVDQKERVRNIFLLINHLLEYFHTNILVGEAGPKDGEKLAYRITGGTYIYVKEDTPYFNRMAMVNILAAEVKTKIIVIQDTDVLLQPEQYLEATKKILEEGYGLVYPYDGNFYNIPAKYINGVTHAFPLSSIKPSMCNNLRPRGDSVGGIMFWDRAKFLECGGCNEHFLSWGFDDTEMYERAEKLEVKIGRCAGGLYHLSHKPSLNSLNGSHPHYKNNEEEWLKVKGMSKEQLLAYIKTWR